VGQGIALPEAVKRAMAEIAVDSDVASILMFSCMFRMDTGGESLDCRLRY
jgi:hypothetical protein